MMLRLFSRYCLSDSSPSIIYPRDCVPVFFAFGSDRKRIRTLRLVQPYRLVFNCFARLEKVYFLFIALKRMYAFCKKVLSGFRFWC